MIRELITVAGVLAALLLGVMPYRDAVRAAQDDDDEEPYRAGLVARQIDARGTSVERLVAAVQFPLDVAADSPPASPVSSPNPAPSESPARPSGSATADADRVIWRGRLWVQAPGAYRLFSFSQGLTRITLQGNVVLRAECNSPRWHGTEELELPFGYLPFEVEYSRSQLGAVAGQLSLYWSGPQFGLEPIPPRFLVHPREATPTPDVAAARRLTRALRCAACHDMADEPTPLASPALDRVRDSLRPEWTVEHLVATHQAAAVPRDDDQTDGRDAAAPAAYSLERRMPFFALSRTDAADLTAFLFERSLPPALDVHDRPDARAKPTTKTSTKSSSRAKANAKASREKADSAPSAERGRRLLASIGCLACHRYDGLGTSGPFDGGDLTRLADKRPEGFVERWLASPASINRHHRMPVMELTPVERADLAKLLEAAPTDGPTATTEAAPGDPERGAVLFESQRCQACHASPDGGATPPKLSRRLEAKINWDESCLAPPNPVGQASAKGRPSYSLPPALVGLVRAYVEQIVLPANVRRSSSDAARRSPDDPANASAPKAPRADEPTLDSDWLVENQCLNCHARDDQGGLSDVAVTIARKYSELAPAIHGLLPPSLSSVGDKLNDAALATAIRRSADRRRPWLAVRMPKYDFTDSQLHAAVARFVRADRIPPNPPAAARAGRVLDESELNLEDAALRTVGGRLVTTDGFGCLSCHAVGAVAPPNAPLNQRAPDLSQLASRIRPEWFDRWTRNPARIVPRMEMPSVQLPVRGVLDEQLDRQLAAVWHALNRPDFVPPEPNPVQTLRLSGLGNSAERVEIVTDVLQADGRVWIKPLLIGLPNRNNVLLDLETNRLARWSLGDVARQRTKGKTWFWEAAGVNLLDASSNDSELLLDWDGRQLAPLVTGQFPTEIDAWRHIAGGLEFSHRLRFAAVPANEPTRSNEPERANEGASQVDAAEDLPAIVVHVRQRFVAIETSSIAARNGFRREVSLAGIPDGARVLWRVLSGEQSKRATFERDERRWRLDDGSRTVAVIGPAGTIDAQGVITVASTANRRAGDLTLEYRSTLANDQFPPVSVPPLPKPAVQTLDVVPGFAATRLPLSDQQMPTSLAWRSDGTLLVASLKGRVWLARDTDGDGLEDQWQAVSDELAAPYGVAAAVPASMSAAIPAPSTDRRDTKDKNLEPIDVATKYAVLRLWDDDGDGRADRTQTIASGWGHTADYHDWTVGMPSDGQGGYFIGLACQQDKRSVPAARLRGTMLHLVPRTPTNDDPRPFDMELVSAGHRFPMGIAINRAGDVFVTDNQGNYNPFNELNHVRQGRRYGFINALEQKPDFRPPTESPAIEIPHPWTRSVNGICFLDAPAATNRAATDSPPRSDRPFGPFTGHLIGCEYDTRRLIRMSLTKIGDTYQGACYPFSSDDAPAGSAESSLLGPICCAVSPHGDLYVGGIRDSGWGGGNNIGEVVRLRFDAERLPAGIAEVRTTRRGLEIDFTRPVDPVRAADATQYAISSYRRVSTPAYGGPDVDRRTDRITRVEVSADARRVRVDLAELRHGFVYELRLQNLSQNRERFFPAEAYITLRDQEGR